MTKPSYRKGKTYEEIYGPEKAKEIREKQSKPKDKRSTRKGRTLEQLYGKERAEEIKEKMRKAWTKERREQKSKEYKELWAQGTPPPNAGWSKGLTKETDERIRKQAEKSSKTMTKLWAGDYKYKDKIIGILHQNTIKNASNPETCQKISNTLLTKHTFEERQSWAIKGLLGNKNKDTSIELALQKGLSEQNIKFDTQVIIPGICVVDIVPKDSKIAIFADGDYWHSNPKFYDHTKLDEPQKQNINRDIKVNELLKEQGWVILRFWEHEINDNLDNCISQILEVLPQ